MPKYNIGDKVWKVVDQKCVEKEVSGVQSTIGSFEYSVAVIKPLIFIGISSLELKHIYEPESYLFPSKEALLEYLSS